VEELLHHHATLAHIMVCTQLNGGHSCALALCNAMRGGDNRDISENERAILNILVSSYLKDFGYKISAITFIEEIGSKQDLSNLEGLNLHLNNRSKLLHLYRNRTAPVAEKIELENALHDAQKKLNAAKMKIKNLV
jgi:hypothetical protein